MKILCVAEKRTYVMLACCCCCFSCCCAPSPASAWAKLTFASKIRSLDCKVHLGDLVQRQWATERECRTARIQNGAASSSAPPYAATRPRPVLSQLLLPIPHAPWPVIWEASGQWLGRHGRHECPGPSHEQRLWRRVPKMEKLQSHGSLRGAHHVLCQ